MPDGLVRLIWEVDSRGYDIMRLDLRDPGIPQELRVFRPVPGFQTIHPRYDVMEFITARGGKPRHYEVGLPEHSIFLDLANSAQRPGRDGVREFVNKWGLLTKGLFDEPAKYTPLDDFLRQRNSVVQALDHSEDGIASLLETLLEEPGSYSFYRTQRRNAGPLHACYTGKRGLYFEADTLLQFCALELLHAYTGGINVTACHACGRLLPIHKQGRPKRYCDDACKMAAWRAKHRNAINRKRRRQRATA